jgi:hypothetical protein
MQIIHAVHFSYNQGVFMSSAIDQLEAAGVVNASNLKQEVRDRINSETSDSEVKAIIAFHQRLQETQSDPQPVTPDPDGGMF